MEKPVLCGQPAMAAEDAIGTVSLVVGLGNPGPEYAEHRHNLGFRVVDALAGKHGLAFTRLKGKVRVAEGEICGQNVILAKPQTFMNLSGKAVSRASRYFEVTPENILVVCDDLDLPLGRLRLRPEGGSGGHKGLRSIIDLLGTQSFARLRIGIDRPMGRMDPADYVLQPFAEDEEAILAEVVRQAVAAVECTVTAGIVAAMDRFNRVVSCTGEHHQETQA